MSFNEGGQKNTDFTSKPRSPRFTLPFVTTPLKGRFVVFFTVAFDRLFYVRLGDCPAGIEHPARARNRGKATVKIGRNAT